MEIRLIVENCKKKGRKHIKVKKHSKGYFKLDRKQLLDALSPKDFKTLVKNGMYFYGIDSKSNSDIYIQRLVLALYYNIVGLQGHHLLLIKVQNNIYLLIPMPCGIHQKINGWENSQKGIDKSLELEKELQIEQFAKTKKSRYSVQKTGKTILQLLELCDDGLSKKEIAKKMKDTACEKMIYDYANHFYYANEFLDFLENQSITEFTDLYSILGEEWRYVADWEKNKAKNLQEFETENASENIINGNLALIPQELNNDGDYYSGCITIDNLTDNSLDEFMDIF